MDLCSLVTNPGGELDCLQNIIVIIGGLKTVRPIPGPFFNLLLNLVWFQMPMIRKNC